MGSRADTVHSARQRHWHDLPRPRDCWSALLHLQARYALPLHGYWGLTAAGLFRHEQHVPHDAQSSSAVDSSLDEPVTDLATAMATSYGFRGEALASLIDLADSVSLASRSRDSTGEGWCVVWDRGNKTQLLREAPPSLKAQAHPIGTTVTVRGLFQPTPVRRRVLEAAIEKGTEHRRVVTMLYDTVHMTRLTSAGTATVSFARSSNCTSRGSSPPRATTLARTHRVPSARCSWPCSDLMCTTTCST
jgi:hypothetical protein